MIPDRLSALSHPVRLAVLRLLIRRFPDAVPAGEVQGALDLKPSTASAYFAALRGAGLITQDRRGTTLLYRADLPGIRSLFGGILSDCCQGRPDLCLTSADPEGVHDMTTPSRPMRVLFICTGNSARSIMAEAILNAEGEGRFIAMSAGTRPGDAPHAEVIDLLNSKGLDTADLHSKSVDTFSGAGQEAFDFVFTVCDHAANEECPAWPGQPISAHWGLPDPVKATGTEAQRKLAFQQAFGLLRNRLTAFINLPFDTLDRISLQHRVDDIGATRPETA